jgi:PAS domain S-box-containing protein
MVGTALAVCVGYYIGANVGFLLRLPPTAPSILWPPNAILTVALLLAPPRRWGIYLLAALPAHLAAGLGTFPASLVLAWFVTNCGEALMAAAGMRLLSDAPTRFDTLRRVTIFLAAAVGIAPFVSSFLDAAAVHAILGEPYWSVWRTRTLSNVLTELTVVPALVMAIRAAPATLRGASRWRRVEAVLVGAAVVVGGYWAFLESAVILGTVPGAPITPLAFVFPFILLAAVRFGPGGVSTALLATTLIAVFGSTHGGGPFTGLPLAESVVGLQIMLTVIAVPLLCLAALIDERRRAQRVLAGRLRFEEMLSRLSRAFLHLPVSAMDDAFERWLGHLGAFLRLDRLVLLRLTREGELIPAYAWTGSHVAAPPSVDHRLPWVCSCLLRDEPVVLARLEDLPALGARDLATLRALGVRSMLAIPLVAGSTVLGGLAFVTLADAREWADDLVQHARLVAEVYAGALARRDAEVAGRASELMRSSILASLSNGVAVLDRDGRVIAVNESWQRFARDAHPWNADVALGVSYLEICDRAARHGIPHAQETLDGIVQVLEGVRERFAFEHRVGPAGAERWFAISVGPLNRPEGGAIVSQTDVTERKRAELDAQQSRDELAHFTRVSAMGELSASLAHELNQPLTGILANAEAARRLLDSLPDSLDELNGALADIVEDGKRAGEVIHRVRDFLRKGAHRHGPLNVNGVIQDTARLVTSDALLRNVRIELELEPDLPGVTGDRVQVQQVILNLLLNAMEAMGESGGTGQPVLIRTERGDTRSVRVAVQDAGGGLRMEPRDAVFEPFFTTKSGGMGMGLAIARSIIETHGGEIWATNNVTRGATFFFTLPAAGDAA